MATHQFKYFSSDLREYLDIEMQDDSSEDYDDVFIVSAKLKGIDLMQLDVLNQSSEFCDPITAAFYEYIASENEAMREHLYEMRREAAYA
jgi:hypothetical protein